jgi:hypothetical protein
MNPPGDEQRDTDTDRLLTADAPDARGDEGNGGQGADGAGARPTRWSTPQRFRRTALSIAAGATVALVIAIVAGTLPWQTQPIVPDAARVSPSPSSSAGITTPPVSPTARPPIIAYAAEAVLTAGSATGAVVALDSDFRLASLDGSPATELAARLSVEPALDLAVEPQPDGTSVRLRPAAPLQPGLVYRFTLKGQDGRPLDTWAFQAKAAVRVVATVPRNTETDVPLNAGIEITFDQDGVVDPASRVVIEPRTAGRFERNGRSLAFVPNRLNPATLYSVTVKRGIKVNGTDETMAEDFHFRFETAAKAGTTVTTFNFPGELLEVPTASRPDLPIWAFNDAGTVPKVARIEVYRFRDVGGAIDAFRQLRGAPRWARWSTDDAVPTAGLPRVMAFDARLRRGGDSLWFRMPAKLAAGWYLVQRPSKTRPTQVVLQVTDVAAYLSVSGTRTLVWANDLATGRTLANARVVLERAEIGRTDADGLLMVTTPAQLLADPAPACATDACVPVVIVTAADGRQIFMPATQPADQEGSWSDAYRSFDRADSYWLTYHSDRLAYRRTDTVNLWGVIRDRASGAVPTTVDVDLVTAAGDPMPPAIMSARAQPGPTGAFTASLQLRDLPEGSYDVVLRTGTVVVASTQIQVARILKPAYRLEVETGRRVYIAGDRIRITSRASFYEGSPVPGVPLRISGRIERNVRTDATGTAVYRTTARVDNPDGWDSGYDYQSVSVSPARAEEGDIAGSSSEFLVFPSSRTVRADASIADGRVWIKGAVHVVDRDRLEAAIAAGSSPWDLDPRGGPVRGATVSLEFVAGIPIRTQVGTQYDWIEKKVVPLYDYHVNHVTFRTVRVRTAADGSFSASARTPSGRHDFHVRISVPDRDGHMAREIAYVSDSRASTDPEDYGYLEPSTPAAAHADGYAVGDAIDLTVHETRPSSTGRYLFQFAQRGIRDATVQRSPRLQARFQDWAVPNVVISGVHFTGTRYIEIGEYGASFRNADRAVDVGLTTTRQRYAPGDEVTLDVRTRDRQGNSVAATVILQAVDEKLYAIGAAQDANPLGDLYAYLSSGIRTRFTSHRSHDRPGGEGGDTAGGDGEGRLDFRDALLFTTVETGIDGRARTTFRLSDDLTSWRVSGAAVTADLGAGSKSIKVPVGLPFFVDASIAPEYLVGDRPSIQVRTYGTALTAGSDVRITIESDSLPLAPKTVRAKAFGTVTVALPRLRPGLHTVTISATTGAGASAKIDRVTRSFAVIDTRLERTMTAYSNSVGSAAIPGGAGITTVVISDASAGRYLPLLLGISGGQGARLERALAATMASSLLRRSYSAPDGVRPAVDLDGASYQTPDGGIAPVPFASSDLELSALVAIVAPERFRTGPLGEYLRSVLSEPKSTRERRTYALAGLAGLRAPVLPQIQTAAVDPALTIRERLIVGLGAAAIGDGATARTIAAVLWADHGEEVAGSARLRVGDSAADITAGTSLMAVLAAATGDPRAPALWAYVEANPSSAAPHELFAVAYVDRIIDRLPVEPASFAYVIDGKRTEVELDTGEAFRLDLTAAQRASLEVEPIKGSIGIASTWREPVAATTFKRDPDISVRRERAPAVVVRTSDLVRIDLLVRFGSKAPAGCHQVSELVPSGLIPMGPMESWYAEEVDGDSPRIDVTTPYDVVGQRVMFCAEPTRKDRSVRLRYYARVITPGTYRWEPAVVESRTSPDRAALTRETTVRIR